VNCWTPSCRALGGAYLRELSEYVGAPGGGGMLLDNPLSYLGESVAQTATDSEPAELPSKAARDGEVSRLFSTKDAITYLLNERGLLESTVLRAGIGWDGSAFTFPIKDATGELVNVVRRPWPHVSVGRDGRPRKYITMRGRNRHNGGVQLYPDVPATGPLLLCEGLLDALIGRQHDLPAITSTHGVSTFLDEWLPLMKGRRVAVMFDIGAEDEMHRRVEKLREAGAQAWPVRLSRLLSEGKDLTDALTGGHTAEDVLRLIRRERGRWSS
jgi:hypothetical protein